MPSFLLHWLSEVVRIGSSEMGLQPLFLLHVADLTLILSVPLALVGLCSEQAVCMVVCVSWRGEIGR